MTKANWCVLLLVLAGSSACAAAESTAGTLDEMYRWLASRRCEQIDRLRNYADRGEFPRNTDFPSRVVPYFVDHAGTHCAVGYLVHRDGRDDIVAGVVSLDNHILIQDVCEGPLIDWIGRSGLTK